jgi:eukaryotic-like serine/threonine-protein kinase
MRVLGGGGMRDATTQVGEENLEGNTTGEIRAGRVVGEYVIEELVSSGGHGSVYRSRHKTKKTIAAIKVLHPAVMALPRMAERFVQEVEVILRLRHPNIVQVQELGRLPDGTLYYVMEYLQGTTLRSFLSARGRLPPDEALSILEPVCAALAVAHEANIVHRDVKASNIMICDGPERVVKLLDFGIAKLVAPGPDKRGLTSVGQQLGTPSIMAPEQILCGPIDARTDIYALGALLYTLLTGRPPFESLVPGDLVEQHLAVPPPRPSQRAPLSPVLDAVVLRCLEKRPERRFESVGAFLDTLRDAVRDATDGHVSEEMERRAVGILVDVRIPEGTDDPDDELVTLMADKLERTEECMRSGGFLLASLTSTQLLGVRLLSDDLMQERNERRSAMEFGLTLHAALQKNCEANPNLHVNVAIHASTVNVRSSADLEIASGPMARTDEWAPREDVAELIATPTALEGLTSLPGFVLTPGPAGRTLVRRQGQVRTSMRSYTIVSGGVKA